ncbi:MAG TPA: DUF697 domain-containing protein [Verrucomicrobiales bacterium]|nr:DUF697 domain-containing protein [Verrucomicrobiales bacterium]HIL99209.1 DUF697 domain-containing protein [Pseudomonadales bacterium]
MNDDAKSQSEGPPKPRRRRRLYETEESNDSTNHSTDPEQARVEAGAPEKGQNQTEDELRVSAADNTIKYYCFWSFSTALIPVPLVDLAAMSAIQAKMISELSELYEVPFSQGLAKKAIATLVASASSSSFASLIKLVPGIGYFGLAIPLATLNVSYTYAVGKIFAQHFQSGADLASFDPNAQKANFKEKLEEGKEYARKAKQTFKQKLREKRDKN